MSPARGPSQARGSSSARGPIETPTVVPETSECISKAGSIFTAESFDAGDVVYVKNSSNEEWQPAHFIGIEGDKYKAKLLYDDQKNLSWTTCSKVGLNKPYIHISRYKLHSIRLASTEYPHGLNIPLKYCDYAAGEPLQVTREHF